ncbi:MAG: prepilin peptidase [Eubacteriales bacterium]|nr:prepilin peptidase [Eubacteriales bacterium]
MELGAAILFGTCCSVTDWRRQKIMALPVWLGLAAGLCLTAWRLYQGTEGIYGAAAALVPAAVFWGLSLLTEGKIGRGDALMLLVLGLILGWRLCLSVLCMACLMSAVWAGAGLTLGKLTKGSRLPFAPFLLAALLVTGVCL